MYLVNRHGWMHFGSLYNLIILPHVILPQKRMSKNTFEYKNKIKKTPFYSLRLYESSTVLSVVQSLEGAAFS